MSDVSTASFTEIFPLHFVKILMESYERFMEFLKRSNAVSPTVAMETATALQVR